MIRDPSDGSVRAPQKPEVGIPISENLLNSRATAAQPETSPVIEATTSGLPTGSSKPENIAGLEKSREWLKQYFHRKTEGE